MYYATNLVEEHDATGRVVWTALHPELRGCTAAATSPTEAVANLAEAREAWLAAANQLGRSYPQPSQEDQIVEYYYLASPASPTIRGGNMSADAETVTVPVLVAA